MPPPQSPEIVSGASAGALELSALLALLAELTASDLGRRLALELRPLEEREPLERRRRMYQEAARLLEEGPLVPDLEQPLQPLVEALERRDEVLEGPDLLTLAQALRAGEEATRRIAAAEVVELGSAAAGLGDPRPLCREIARALDRRGRVRDDASPELAALRRKIRGAREGLYGRLRETGERLGEHLGEDTIPMKDGRLVLLLRSSARGRVQGLVHGRSGTGRSLYFEPLEVVEANNELQEALTDEEAERRRILARLVAAARADLPLVAEHFRFLAELDLLQASARFAARCGGELPALGRRHELRLVGARHPLLEPGLADLRAGALGRAGHTGPVVPLDVELSAEGRVLVITGPNAGGKTVALKTVGLLALAAQCGLPIPAEPGSRVPLFDGVLAAVGDDQDLLTDQSTFSGRLLRLREAWERASPDSLLLLDEVGSGTDPEEGAALAVAFLEGLLESRTLAVLTTHLTRLALAAVELEGAACGAMEFDRASGRPTYRLRPGAPGGSEALALAERLELPRVWLERARELTGRGDRDLRRVLEELEEIRSRLAAEEARTLAETAALERERSTLEREREALESERRELAPRLRRDLDAFRRKVHQRLRAEVESMRAEVESGRHRGVASAAARRALAGEPSLPVEEPAAAGELEVGGRVRHVGFGWEGRLDKLGGKTAEVLVEGKRVRCGPGELRAVEEPAAAAPAVTVRLQRDGGEEEPAAPAELNLIGRRVEPALAELDAYLDRILLDSRGEVRVIHGFGSGRLRRAVREHLREHPAVGSFRPGRPEEGGDGATVVRPKAS